MLHYHLTSYEKVIWRWAHIFVQMPWKISYLLPATLYITIENLREQLAFIIDVSFCFWNKVSDMFYSRWLLLCEHYIRSANWCMEISVNTTYFILRRVLQSNNPKVQTHVWVLFISSFVRRATCISSMFRNQLTWTTLMPLISYVRIVSMYP